MFLSVKVAPIPTEVKLSILIYRENYLSRLITRDIHRKLKHAGTKQTLTELKQKYWICQSRNYGRIIIRRCLTCCKLHCKPCNYPKTPSLTKFRLADTQPFPPQSSATLAHYMSEICLIEVTVK